jgi:hypothetical protein
MQTDLVVKEMKLCHFLTSKREPMYTEGSIASIKSNYNTNLCLRQEKFKPKI